MSRTKNRKSLTESVLRRVKPGEQRQVLWDTHRNLACIVQPSGSQTWYYVYSHLGRPRWYRIGKADDMSVEDARRRVRSLAGKVADGHDVHGARRELLGADSFEALHTRYLDQHAKRHNKSWQQGDKLVRRYALPKFGKLKASTITRSNVRELIASLTATPTLANQVLAAMSAVFTWAEREEAVSSNPCRGIQRNQVQSRSRVLSVSELARFWPAFDSAGLLRSTALKIILFTGQRPGEVAAMRHEHIRDGWWEMPGGKTDTWPGTKNSRDHRVHLVDEVRDLIDELGTDKSGYVFGCVLGELDTAMRPICTTLKAPRATPHDLRRTCGSTITALGHGRQAMDRILNHADNSVGSMYDRHSYEKEDRGIMQSVARRIIASIAGKTDDNVRVLRRG